MRVSTPDIFIHHGDTIAFDARGDIVFTLAQVEALQAFHMGELIKAVLLGAPSSADHHRAAERVFRLAMEDHSKQRMRRAA